MQAVSLLRFISQQNAISRMSVRAPPQASHAAMKASGEGGRGESLDQRSYGGEGAGRGGGGGGGAHEAPRNLGGSNLEGGHAAPHNFFTTPAATTSHVLCPGLGHRQSGARSETTKVYDGRTRAK
jgi:hypothetical protein